MANSVDPDEISSGSALFAQVSVLVRLAERVKRRAYTCKGNNSDMKTFASSLLGVTLKEKTLFLWQ